MVFLPVSVSNKGDAAAAVLGGVELCFGVDAKVCDQGLDEIECAVLKSRSPTCGVNQVYDGSFSGKLISGSGIFAQALRDSGCRVIDAEVLSK